MYEKTRHTNRENPRVGAEFQRLVSRWFNKYYGKGFLLEKKIPIGNPPKDHKFDIVSEDNTVAVECKCYTWTESGNVPSAKMGFANEAVFYLSFLPDTYEKYLVMSYSWNEKRGQSLAEYYFETNKHLLGKTKIAEYNSDTEKLRIIQ